VDALVIAADNIMNSAQRQVEFATQAEQLLLTAAPAGVDLKPVEENLNQRVGTSALSLADEMERRAALANSMAEPAASQEAATAQQEASSEPEAPAEPEVPPVEEQAALPEAQADIKQAEGEKAPQSEEPASQPAEQAAQPTADGEEASQEASAAGEESKLETEQEADDVAAAEGETQPPAAAAILEQAEGESPGNAEAEAAVDDAAAVGGAADLAVDEKKKLTLADVDREAAEAEAQVQEPAWNVGQLRELVGVLSTMAGEATQQERNARTLTFKLRAMLQGMPNTRRVDMMAAWLRTALDAVTQSATQVQQASKTIPASAFQAARKERADTLREEGED
jgi:hypothetical protein